MSADDMLLGGDEPQRTTPNWVGRRVRLLHKAERYEVGAVITSDPAQGETRFTTDFGDEVGALDWYWTLD